LHRRSIGNFTNAQHNRAQQSRTRTQELPVMKKESGFSLVEMMVAMAVALVALAATVAAFRDSSYTNQRVALKSDITDNLRAGMNFIQQDLIQAGTGIPVGGISIPNSGAAGGGCPTGVSNLNRPALNATTFPACNTTLPAVEPGDGLGNTINTPDASSVTPTDLISMMYIDVDKNLGLNNKPINQAPFGPDPGCLGTISPNGSTVFFDGTTIYNGVVNCVDLSKAIVPINPGDLIMFSNANGNAIQAVTSVSGQTLTFASGTGNGDAYRLNGTGQPSGTLIQLQNYTTNALGTRVYNGTYPPTTASRIWMISYYLDDTTDPGRVRLLRRTNFKPGVVVGETIENFQLTYNYVSGGVVLANQSAVPVGFSENQIRSVNVYLGARSDTATNNSGTNAYIRNSLQTQVCLRSMSYVNQYQ
jgi:prepilin-type N-terminal cleavage/methylation domain-containing protein